MVLQFPLAAFIRRQARLHPKLRETMIGFGQAAYRRTANSSIQPTLNAERAVRLSSDIAAQLFVFTICGGMVYYSEQSHKAVEEEKHDVETLAKKKKELGYLKAYVESSARDLEFFLNVPAVYEELRKSKYCSSRVNTREDSGS